MHHTRSLWFRQQSTAGGNYSRKVNTARTDSRTSQALVASNGKLKIFFSLLWVFAWNQALRAQSPNSEIGKEIACLLPGSAALQGKFCEIPPPGQKPWLFVNMPRVEIWHFHNDMTDFHLGKLPSVFTMNLKQEWKIFHFVYKTI